MKWNFAVATALIVNLALFIGMAVMTRSERLLLNSATPSIPIDFLRLAMNPEEELARRYRDPPPPSPEISDDPLPEVDVSQMDQNLSPMPKSISLTRIAPGLDSSGARLAAGRLTGGSSSLGTPQAVGEIPFVEESSLITLVRTMPFYPVNAQRQQVEGEVVIGITVNERGHVENPSVVRSEPPGVFDQAAMAAIVQWRFKPEVRGGKPTAVRTRIRFQFRLPEQRR